MHDLIADGFQKARAAFQRGFAIGIEGRPRQGARLVDLGAAGLGKVGRHGRAGRGVHRLQRTLAVVDGALADEDLAGDGGAHILSPMILCAIGRPISRPAGELRGRCAANRS